MNEETKTVLLVPRLDNADNSSVDIARAENVNDLVLLIEAEAYIISIADLRLVEMLVKYPDVFGVELSLLTGVVGADYNSAFDNMTWGLDRVSYDTLVMEAATAARMEKLKQDERPKASGNRPRDLTADEVKDLKVPEAIDFGGPDE